MDIKTLDMHRESMREALRNGVYYRITDRRIFKYACPKLECKFETVHVKGIRNHMFNIHPVIEP
jgi:hypothetical protein